MRGVVGWAIIVVKTQRQADRFGETKGKMLVTTALIFLGSMCFASMVKEKTSFYSCCGGARIKFDPTCEHTWSTNDGNFAHTKDDTKRCMPPCKEINDGWIVLDFCQPVNVTITCINEKNYPEDTIISYLSKECQHSGIKPGSSIGSLVLIIIVGQLLKWMMD